MALKLDNQLYIDIRILGVDKRWKSERSDGTGSSATERWSTVVNSLRIRGYEVIESPEKIDDSLPRRFLVNKREDAFEIAKKEAREQGIILENDGEVNAEAIQRDYFCFIKRV